MNMAYNLYSSQEFEFQEGAPKGGTEKIAAKRTKRANYSTAANRPQLFNGMHRRRNRRFAW